MTESIAYNILNLGSLSIVFFKCYLQKGAPLRAYKEKHRFINYKIDDEYDKSLIDFPYPEDIEGPVFQYFLETDFLSYASFREFINLVGIEVFTFIQPALKKKLSNIMDISKQRKPEPISRDYVENLLRKIKKRMNNEQNLMYAFSRRFSNEFPVLDRLKEVEIDDLEILEKVNEHLIFDVKINVVPDKSLFEKNFRASARSWLKEESQEQYQYSSIISRCYRELLHLIQDGKKVKSCKNCHKLFFADIASESYCDRTAPEKINEYNELWQGVLSYTRNFQRYGDKTGKDLIPKEDFEEIEKLTCKKVGPYKVWKKTLSSEELAFFEEKKRRQARLYYLRDKKDERYQTESEEFERWVRKKEPKKDSAK